MEEEEKYKRVDIIYDKHIIVSPSEFAQIIEGGLSGFKQKGKRLAPSLGSDGTIIISFVDGSEEYDIPDVLSSKTVYNNSQKEAMLKDTTGIFYLTGNE